MNDTSASAQPGRQSAAGSLSSPAADPSCRHGREQRPVRLRRQQKVMYAGGSVTYRVFLGDRWVGWVGDGHPWRGSRWGGRRWWACWREDGDQYARWNTDLDFPTRTAAVDALTAHITAAAAASPGSADATKSDVTPGNASSDAQE